MQRFKCKKLLTGEERVAERLVYILFDTVSGERSTNGADGLLAALDDKHHEVSLYATSMTQVSIPFKQEPCGEGNPTIATTTEI
jgi:uncharacterized membrane protein